MFRWKIKTFTIVSCMLIFALFFEMTIPIIGILDIAKAEASTSSATNIICGQDLNNDGYVDGSNETAACIQSTSLVGHLCPIGAVNCAATYSMPSCPAGTNLNPVTDKCEAMPQVSCPTGYTYDSSFNKCVQSATCFNNGILNPNTDKCEILASNLCPLGFTYSLTHQACVKSVLCPLGGIYNPITDRCELIVSHSCSLGTIYNNLTSRCEASPSCVSGFMYNATVNACVQSATIGCPSGYMFNSGTGRCEHALPICPTGGSYSSTSNKCEAVPITQHRCPLTGHIFSNLTTCNTNCVQTASCALRNVSISGNVTTTVRVKRVVANGNRLDFFTCTSAHHRNIYIGYIFERGATFSGSVGFHQYSIVNGFGRVVANGNRLDFFDQHNRFVGSIHVSGVAISGGFNLAGGSTLLRNVLPVNANQFTLVDHFGFARGHITFTSTTVTCPLGSHIPCSGNPSTCSVAHSCTTHTSCPSGYTLSGGICIANPICHSGGTFNAVTDKCEITPTFSCPSGSNYDSALQMCVGSAICPSGSSLNGATDRCESVATPACVSGYALDSSTMICHSTPICNQGIFHSVLDKCKITLFSLCPSGYIFNSGTSKCEVSPNCPAESNYSITVNKCVVNAIHDCPTNTLYSSTTMLCESTPICSSGTYNAEMNKCFVGNTTCPLGNFICLNNAGIMQCSPNPCVNLTTTPVEITHIDDTMLQDDGPRDAAGNCLGQIYIFTGRGMRCRVSGLNTGFYNCCNESQGVITDNVGASGTVVNAGRVIGGVKTGYAIVQTGSYAAQIGAGKLGMIGSADTAIKITNEAGKIVREFTGQSAEAFRGIAPHMGADAATNAAMQNWASTLGPQAALMAVTMAINDPALSGVVNIVGQALLGAGPVGIGLAVISAVASIFTKRCDRQDIEVATLRESKFCHFVGSYCERRLPLIGCVQRARGYCCFNSKLGRIIHQQGRQQLLAFQPNGAWGDGRSPSCRGFTPEEFQMLDFSRIDMTEYFVDMQKDIDKKIGNIQIQAVDKIQQFHQDIR